MMYWLIIICQTLAIGNVCLFQISDEWEKNEVYPVVWVSRPTVGIDESVITFSWDGELSVACKSVVEHSSVKTLVALMESVLISATADPKDRSKKAFMLSYNKGEDAYQFKRESTDLDDQTSVVLKTDWNIPRFPQAQAGLCMDDCFIAMVNLGPNLTYRINTETEYGILFGAYRQGDRLNPDDIKNSLRFSLGDFNEHNEKTVVLQSDNSFLPIENGLIPRR
ncbi:MAG: hypothetical protein LBL45_00535 [Treponema sp.]|jgi:hypothetical protein|nr:hypothetical protein [Treponema sp.]